MDADQTFIRRAIRLAMNGRGTVEPNPMVGCVIVKDNRIIGEGYHAKFGGPHAEPAALDACTESPAGATAYVTLEPCCHTGKKTPPCAPRLIHEKIGRVVVGCLDPNPKVNGNGVRMLREAGITVDGPVLEAECRQLIAPFLASGSKRGRPVRDAEVGRVRRRPRWPAMRRPTAFRSATLPRRGSRSPVCGPGRTAIVVGIGTAPDRQSDAHGPEAVPTPTGVAERIVLDSHLRTAARCSNVVSTARDVQTRSLGDRHLCGLGLGIRLTERVRCRTGVASSTTSMPTPIESEGSARCPLSEMLLPHGCAAGSASTCWSSPARCWRAAILAVALADRLWLIRSPTTGRTTPLPHRAAAVPDGYVPVGHLDLDGDVLTEYLNTRSPAYLAAVPSADLVLAGEVSPPATPGRAGPRANGIVLPSPVSP